MRKRSFYPRPNDQVTEDDETGRSVKRLPVRIPANRMLYAPGSKTKGLASHGGSVRREPVRIEKTPQGPRFVRRKIIQEICPKPPGELASAVAKKFAIQDAPIQQTPGLTAPISQRASMHTRAGAADTVAIVSAAAQTEVAAFPSSWAPWARIEAPRTPILLPSKKPSAETIRAADAFIARSQRALDLDVEKSAPGSATSVVEDVPVVSASKSTTGQKSQPPKTQIIKINSRNTISAADRGNTSIAMTNVPFLIKQSGKNLQGMRILSPAVIEPPKSSPMLELMRKSLAKVIESPKRPSLQETQRPSVDKDSSIMPGILTIPTALATKPNTNQPIAGPSFKSPPTNLTPLKKQTVLNIFRKKTSVLGYGSSTPVSGAELASDTAVRETVEEVSRQVVRELQTPSPAPEAALTEIRCLLAKHRTVDLEQAQRIARIQHLSSWLEHKVSSSTISTLTKPVLPCAQVEVEQPEVLLAKNSSLGLPKPALFNFQENNNSQCAGSEVSNVVVPKVPLAEPEICLTTKPKVANHDEMEVAKHPQELEVLPAERHSSRLEVRRHKQGAKTPLKVIGCEKTGPGRSISTRAVAKQMDDLAAYLQLKSTTPISKSPIRAKSVTPADSRRERRAKSPTPVLGRGRPRLSPSPVVSGRKARVRAKSAVQVKTPTPVVSRRGRPRRSRSPTPLVSGRPRRSKTQTPEVSGRGRPRRSQSPTPLVSRRGRPRRSVSPKPLVRGRGQSQSPTPLGSGRPRRSKTQTPDVSRRGRPRRSVSPKPLVRGQSQPPTPLGSGRPKRSKTQTPDVSGRGRLGRAQSPTPVLSGTGRPRRSKTQTPEVSGRGRPRRSQSPTPLVSRRGRPRRSVSPKPLVRGQSQSPTPLGSGRPRRPKTQTPDVSGRGRLGRAQSPTPVLSGTGRSRRSKTQTPDVSGRGRPRSSPSPTTVSTGRGRPRSSPSPTTVSTGRGRGRSRRSQSPTPVSTGRGRPKQAKPTTLEVSKKPSFSKAATIVDLNSNKRSACNVDDSSAKRARTTSEDLQLEVSSSAVLPAPLKARKPFAESCVGDSPLAAPLDATVMDETTVSASCVATIASESILDMFQKEYMAKQEGDGEEVEISAKKEQFHPHAVAPVSPGRQVISADKTYQRAAAEHSYSKPPWKAHSLVADYHSYCESPSQIPEKSNSKASRMPSLVSPTGRKDAKPAKKNETPSNAILASPEKMETAGEVGSESATRTGSCNPSTSESPRTAASNQLGLGSRTTQSPKSLHNPVVSLERLSAFSISPDFSQSYHEYINPDVQLKRPNRAELDLLMNSSLYTVLSRPRVATGTPRQKTTAKSPRTPSSPTPLTTRRAWRPSDLIKAKSVDKKAAARKSVEKKPFKSKYNSPARTPKSLLPVASAKKLDETEEAKKPVGRKSLVQYHKLRKTFPNMMTPVNTPVSRSRININALNSVAKTSHNVQAILEMLEDT